MNGVSASGNACRDEAVRQKPESHRPPFRFSDTWKAAITDLPIRDESIFEYLPLADDKEVMEIGPSIGFPAFRLFRLRSGVFLLFVCGKIRAFIFERFHEQALRSARWLLAATAVKKR
jgi:hypothetical protein